MRDILTATVTEMETPSAALRSEAAAATATAEAHVAILDAWPCLQTIEACPPGRPTRLPRELTIGAWNMERCKSVEDNANLIRRMGIDVLLATEMDWGMARSGQRHTTRDLATELGFGYVFATEFVELGTGDAYETSIFAGIPNDHGLHGNAILSRYPLNEPRVIPFDQSGRWFTGSPKSDGQRRVGARMAVTAEIDTAFGPLGLVAVHYESESDAEARAVETRMLLSGLSRSNRTGPMVIGGDLNTSSLAGQSVFDCLHRPSEREPSFTAFVAAGFDWRTANDGTPTTRAAPGRKVRYPLTRLDWLFARSLSALDARTIPAVSATGNYLSDHELIIARFGP